MPNSRKPLVVVTRRLPDVVETRMRELFDARLNVDDAPMSQADLIEAVKTAEVLVPTVTDKIDRSVLSQAGPQLYCCCWSSPTAVAGHPLLLLLVIL